MHRKAPWQASGVKHRGGTQFHQRQGVVFAIASWRIPKVKPRSLQNSVQLGCVPPHLEKNVCRAHKEKLTSDTVALTVTRQQHAPYQSHEQCLEQALEQNTLRTTFFCTTPDPRYANVIRIHGRDVTLRKTSRINKLNRVVASKHASILREVDADRVGESGGGVGAGSNWRGKPWDTGCALDTRDTHNVPNHPARTGAKGSLEKGVHLPGVNSSELSRLGFSRPMPTCNF